MKFQRYPSARNVIILGRVRAELPVICVSKGDVNEYERYPISEILS